ncbi:extensin-like [Culex quinquefasciatus]|uniref:extensin-like n=1 Tax=Culex quinquefasciatus TaxID=7176 RepID=UPI0018E31EA8|nr:extensin-like [Culex quinquefasciatus]
MILFLVCSAALTFAVGQVESNSYSSYSAPQKPCSGGSFCGGHPNSLPFEPRYPSIRVGVSPGYPGESEGGNYESNEAPESSYGGPSKEVGPLCPQPPPPANDENQLPVSVCVQLPPKTPLKLSKSILQQIIFSLTESRQDVDPVVDPAVPEPGSLPVYTPVQVPVYSPQPTYAPPPPQAAPAPQQPIYSPQPSYPPQPPQVYAESPVYAPQPAGPVNPVEHVVYEQEPIPTTPSSIPAHLTPRYPTYESSGSTGASGQLPPYVQQQGRPGGTCQSCGSSLKPRYNQ